MRIQPLLTNLLFTAPFFSPSEAANVSESLGNDYFHKYTYTSQYSTSKLFQSTFTKTHLDLLKNETQHLFDYAWMSYMQHGYPYDEVLPLTCKPNLRDYNNPLNTVKNDALGNFSITLFDAMDTFVIMNNYTGFTHIVDIIEETYTDFNIDSTVQVFETNIRLLGSLITAHLYAVDERKGFKIADYNGHLLKLAYDLGKRLIIAFAHNEDDFRFKENPQQQYLTFSYPRTNLKHGPHNVPYALKYEQCTAGITTLSLEFTMLSKLTGDSIFANVSKRAVFDFWRMRSKLDLLPMSFDSIQRMFRSPQITGIGASIDSFYEYALKFSILFNDDTMFDIWKNSYKALLTHTQNKLGIFPNVHTENGMLASEWMDSLGAFFPGLQVLAGDVPNAVKLHRAYLKLWNNYGAIPERWNFMPSRSEEYFRYLNRSYRNGDLAQGFDEEMTDELLLKNSVGLEWYPLRPEFIESTYHLYRATKDPFYLRVGEQFLQRLREHYIAPCGFAGSIDIVKDIRQNRQESFVLSETLKYLYLLFDVDNPLNKDSGNTIFTTEGHPMWYDRQLAKFSNDSNLNWGVELERMNEYDVTDVESEGFFHKLMHYEQRFDLNEAFANLKERFTENAKQLKPIIYKRGESFNYGVSANKKLLRNDFVEELHFNESEYESYKSQDEFRMESIAMFSYGLNEDEIAKCSADHLNLDVCLKPVDTFVASGILNSHILQSDSSFYRLDNDYAMTLRKPIYYQHVEELELKRDFYDRFVGSDATCSAIQETVEWEAILTLDSTFNSVPILKVNNQFGDWNEGDLLFTELDGLRIQFEELTPGRIDSFGKLVTKEYIETLYPGSIEAATEEEADNVLRITRVNGLAIDTETRLWIHEHSGVLSKHGSISPAHGTSGLVVVNDSVVGNLRVYGPPL